MTDMRYNRTAVVLHWVIAFLVILQIALGFASDWSVRPLSEALLDQHVRVGVIVFGVMLLRLTWRMAHRPPPMPDAVPAWRRRAAGNVYRLFYVLLLAMPITGYVLWAWTRPTLDFWGLGIVPILFTGGDNELWRSIAGYAHEYGAYAISALVLVHIGAALHHQFVARDMRIGDRMGFAPLDESAAAD